MGTSLHTNQSAMSALQTLRVIGNNLDTTQRHVSSGYRVNDAAEDPAYWSISSMMKSDTIALSAVSSAMELGKSQIRLAYEATDKVKSNLDAINKALTTIYEKGAGDVKKIQDAVKGNIKDIRSAVTSSVVAEKNILANDGETVNIAGAYRREGSAVYVDMIRVGGDELNFAGKNADGTLNFSNGVLKDLFANYADLGSRINTLTKAAGEAKDALAAYDKDPVNVAYPSDQVKAAKDAALAIRISDFAAMTEAQLTTIATSKGALEYLGQALQQDAATLMQSVTAAGSVLGSAENQVQGQISYVSKLVDGIDKGIGGLIDADMNAESARLSSLQVQQQLAIQALSIANQNSQNILALYKN